MKKVMYPCVKCGCELSIHAYGLYCKECRSVSDKKENMLDAFYLATGKAAKYILVDKSIDVERAQLTILFANAFAKRLSEAGEKFSNKNIFDSSLFNADFCRSKLAECLKEGDPIDVAIYAAFLWFNDERTSKIETPKEGGWVKINSIKWKTLEYVKLTTFLNDFSNGKLSFGDINGKMYWANIHKEEYFTKPILLVDPIPEEATHVITSLEI